MLDPYNLAPAAIGVLLFLALKTVFDSLNGKKPGPYPPGPKPRFLIGNALDFPIIGAGPHFMKLGTQLQSGLVHLQALRNHILFINQSSIADEILEKRARIYSGRPQVPAADVMGWNAINVALMDYGDDWRSHRKVCQQHLNHKQTRSYEPIQLRHLYKMLHRLLHSPEDFLHHSEVLSTAIIMDIMYGYQIDTLDDPGNVAALTSISIGVPLLMPGKAFMNIIPFLRHIPSWVPGNFAGKRAKECIHWTQEMQRIPLEDVHRRVKEGTATYSVISEFLEKKATLGVDQNHEQVLYNVAYTMYTAAAETTVSATSTFFHMMLTHPEVQKKAQEEIDKTIGTDRLPKFEDRPSLPYIEAIYREVMRYRPPLSIGLGHTATEDDWYDGYFIPKGTTVFGNIWAMTRDEDVYPDANTFNPERFFDERGQLNDDDRILAYGFGRRVCVGKHVASATMWITFVSFLASFTITRAKDEFGKDVEIDEGYEDLGLIAHKKPFKCNISPRSDVARRLVEDSVAEGKE